MKRRKWKRYWIVLAIAILVEVILIGWFFSLNECNPIFEGVKLIIETWTALCGLFLALIIFLKSQEDSAIQQHHAMSQRERMHSEQIKAILNSNRTQSEELKNFMKMQNKSIMDAITQIFKKSNQEDKSFENSMRIYEISKIDAELADLEYLLNEAYFELTQIKEWQFLRMKEEREKEIKDQEKKIQGIQDNIEELKKKRNDLEKGVGKDKT